MSHAAAALKHHVRARIAEVGIIPSIRAASAEHAAFATDTLSNAGIPIIEVTMSVPGAVNVLRHLARSFPDVIVGAGTVLDVHIAEACLDAGAAFLSSPCLDTSVVEFAVKKSALVLAGALTATEVHAALDAGADLVMIFPCGHVGAANYIRSLRVPFPKIPFVAAGGVHHATAGDFIRAGVTAIGVGTDLVPRQAVLERQVDWITELARRFLATVKDARVEMLEKESLT